MSKTWRLFEGHVGELKALFPKNFQKDNWTHPLIKSFLKLTMFDYRLPITDHRLPRAIWDFLAGIHRWIFYQKLSSGKHLFEVAFIFFM